MGAKKCQDSFCDFFRQISPNPHLTKKFLRQIAKKIVTRILFAYLMNFSKFQNYKKNPDQKHPERKKMGVMGAPQCSSFELATSIELHIVFASKLPALRRTCRAP